MTTPAKLRLMLVDDHPVMRAGLANLLNLNPNFEVVAQCDDGESALELWRLHTPDLTLMDISLGNADGIQTLRQLIAEFPDACVLMLTSSEAQEDIHQSLKYGARGYVTKNIRSAELAEAILKAHRGDQALSLSVEQRLAEQQDSGRLTAREIEVLGLVRSGFTNGETGRLLGISERTVRSHVEIIMRKLGAADRASAVARGFETGILKTS